MLRTETESEPGARVLARVLEEHRVLRDMLARMEALAGAVLRGRVRRAKQLREQLLAVDTRFREHTDFEERVLAPELLAADAWGAARVERMHTEHARQREALSELWSAGRDGQPNVFVLALAAWGFARMLRDDMDEEERVSINERVLDEGPIDPHPDTD